MGEGNGWKFKMTHARESSEVSSQRFFFQGKSHPRDEDSRVCATNK